VISRLLDDEAKVRAAAAARPSDWRSWLLLARLEKGEAMLSSLRKAVELNRESAVALNALAWALATSGKPRDALPLANKAVDLAPWSAGAVDTLAEVAYQLGKCSEALTLSRRALVASDRSDEMRKRTAEFESRCARPPAK
jgi:tetratricopeptide (TPR) repeat protein